MMSMQDRPRGGQSGLEDAVRRSAATGVLALDGRNLSSLPEDLVRGPEPQRGRKHGADAATTTVSFEGGSGGWWQVEPISKLSLSRNALARLPSCIVQDCFETLVHLESVDFLHNNLLVRLLPTAPRLRIENKGFYHHP